MSSKAGPNRILIVCDDANMQTLFEIPGKRGDQVVFTSCGAEALRRLEREWFDLVMVDVNMPGLDGGEFLQQAKALRPTTRRMAFMAREIPDSAQMASQMEAYEGLTTPAHHEELKWRREMSRDRCFLAGDVAHLRKQAAPRNSFVNIVGESTPMRDLFRLITVVADSHSTVLIQGETGTGKELIARAIHDHSPRQHRPFVAIDCGAVSESLLESELFGHVRGAFTGAMHGKQGLFQEAHEGTLLLDEIGNTTLAFQAKLLRVLQESEIRAVGGNRSIKVDVRVIASTNTDLRKAVEEKTFRQDLYYRLVVVPLVVPPLRQRREDIPLLADHFLSKYCKRDRLAPKQVSAEALQLLVNAPWPGNVRELEHVIERTVVLSSGEMIQPEDLALPAPEASPPPTGASPARSRLAAAEREVLLQVLREHGWDKRAAARALDIGLSTLYSKLNKYLPSPVLPPARADQPACPWRAA
jgi:DNA-binding NtrC family response regulator